MPESPQLKESAQTTEEVIKKYVSDPEQQYNLLVALSRSMNLDTRGRVSGFSYYVKYHRRKIVNILFHGDNYDEIAYQLGVTSKTIRNDVQWNESHRKATNSKHAR